MDHANAQTSHGEDFSASEASANFLGVVVAGDCVEGRDPTEHIGHGEICEIAHMEDQLDSLRNQTLLENGRQIFPKARQVGVRHEAYFHERRSRTATRFRRLQDRGKEDRNG